MRKLQEVLRLRFELKLGYQQIGRSCAIGVSTVHKYLKRAEAAGVTWPLPDDWDEARVESALFPRRGPTVAEINPARTPPDFAAIHEQLRSSKYVTLQLLWEEYRQGNPEGYRYSRFCELYQRRRSKLDVVLRQEHKAGEKIFVDWAGATLVRFSEYGLCSSQLISYPRVYSLEAQRNDSNRAKPIRRVLTARVIRPCLAA
jgi:hypothetical protein